MRQLSVIHNYLENANDNWLTEVAAAVFHQLLQTLQTASCVTTDRCDLSPSITSLQVALLTKVPAHRLAVSGVLVTQSPLMCTCRRKYYSNPLNKSPFKLEQILWDDDSNIIRRKVSKKLLDDELVVRYCNNPVNLDSDFPLVVVRRLDVLLSFLPAVFEQFNPRVSPSEARSWADRQSESWNSQMAYLNNTPDLTSNESMVAM